MLGDMVDFEDYPTLCCATYDDSSLNLLLLIENCDSKYELKYQGDEGACLDASLEDGDRGEKGGIFGLWPPAGVRSLLSDTRNSNPLPLACHFVFCFVIVVLLFIGFFCNRPQDS